MRKILLILVLLSLSAISFAQVQEAWVAKTLYGPSTESNYGNDVVLDAAGNVYVVGTVEDDDGLVDDDYAGGMVTIKYDKFGNLIWKDRFIMVGLKGSDIEIDPDGNVYAVGYRTVSTTNGTQHSDFLTIKYNHLGILQWSRPYSGPQKTGNSAYLGLDAARNVYIAGTSQGEEVEGSSEDGDYAIIKYDNDGMTQWERRYNGAAPNNRLDELKGMIVDPSGNVYLTGISQKDGRKSTTTIKYSSDGTELWVSRHNKSSVVLSVDEGNDITYDQFGNVYVTGGFSSESNGFETIKYNSEGVQQWVAYYDNPENYTGTAVSLVVDNAQNVYIVGYNKPTGALPLGTQHSIKIIKYDIGGNQQWINNYNLRFISGTSYSKIGTGELEFEDHVARIVIGNDAGLYISTSSVIENGDQFITLKYNSSTGANLWEIKNNGPLYSDTYGYISRNISRALWLDASDNVYVTGESDGKFATIKYTQCEIIIPPSTTINSEPGVCGAQVNMAPSSTGDCGEIIIRNALGTRTFSLDSFYSVGHYHLEAYSPSTGATKRFTIYVEDHELPVINCPQNKILNTDPGVCYVAAVNAAVGTATATDNCDATVTVRGVRSDGLALTANYPPGITTITWTARDPSLNTATCTQTITVVDNVPPTITGESASVVVLSPSNHTMRDVTISYTATDNCAVTSVITVTSNEPINGVGDGDTDPDWIVTDDHHVILRAERSANGTGRVYTVTITATDGIGNTATKTVEVRVPHNIKNPHSGQAFKVGSTVSFEGEFWDKAGNSHTAKWLIDENTTVKATVTEPSGNKNGKVTGSYKFTAPGVYKLQMNVTDQKGITHYSNTAGDLEAIVVIYDPNGGFAYGGGYYNSPAGALRSSPSATGKASYGFTLNYFKNSTYPKGETQFDFKVGSFEFNALNFEYLVINNSMSQFKGTGKIIGGQSGVGFTMTVVDGQLDGSGVDKIRMKIYNRSNGSIIYDNQPGASDAALPTQAVGANSIVVISGTNSSLTQSNTTQKAEMETTAPEVPGKLNVVAYPNPSTNNFTISVNAKTNEKMTMQVVDMYGRIIETRNVNANSPIRFGDRYNAGTYFVRIRQGKEHKEIKLVKLSD